jgi:hypothetical protein
MKEFYMKDDEGELVPITIEKIFSDPSEWNNSLVVVKIGSEFHAPTDDDLIDIYELLNECDTITDVENMSLLITRYDFDVETLKKED